MKKTVSSKNLIYVKECKPFSVKMFLIYIILIALSFIMLLPFFWMISTSLKSNSTIFHYPPQWIPDPPLWENYVHIFTYVPMLSYIQSSVIITLAALIGTVISSSFIAFGLARINFVGRKVIFIIIISTMMIPPQVVIVPQFILFSELGWINTYLPLIVPEWFGVPFAIFLLRQFFMSIPKDLDEAAMIDGCSRFGIYWRIIMPLSKPALAAIAVFAFLWNWNEFLKPLIFINDERLKPLAVGIMAFQGEYTWQWNYVMAASVLMVIPCLIVFFAAQKYFIQGISVTGMKG